MLSKSIIISVALGTVGLAGICTYILRKQSRRTSACELYVSTGTWGHAGKNNHSTSINKYLEHIKSKKNTIQLLRDSTNLIPTLANVEYYAKHPVDKRQADILDEFEELLGPDPSGTTTLKQSTLKLFSAWEDEKNFSKKAKDYDINAMVEKAWSNVVFNFDEYDIDEDQLNQINKDMLNEPSAYVRSHTRIPYKSAQSQYEPKSN